MSISKLIGADTSTEISALSYWESGGLKDYRLFDFSNIPDVDERTRRMGKAVLSYLDEKDPDMIYIEQPKGRQNVELVRKLSRVLGIVFGWAIAHDCYYEEVMPSVWRKYLPEFSQGGKERNELKQESIRVVKERHGIDTHSDDLADSINLADAMLHKYTDDELF